MLILVRAATYAVLFAGIVLVLLPAGVLSRSGVIQPPAIGVRQVAGLVVVAAGAAVALWCVLTFAFVGNGTPAPFDPPRRLVVQGPYSVVRNPMYIGAGIALSGAALFYQLSILPASRLCGPVLSRHPPVCRVVRGAHAAANLRERVRNLLRADPAVVAETVNKRQVRVPCVLGESV